MDKSNHHYLPGNNCHVFTSRLSVGWYIARMAGDDSAGQGTRGYGQSRRKAIADMVEKIGEQKDVQRLRISEHDSHAGHRQTE